MHPPQITPTQPHPPKIFSTHLYQAIINNTPPPTQEMS